MARERWPKARRSSGANQRALRSDSALFLWFSAMATPVRDLSSSHLTGNPCRASPARIDRGNFVATRFAHRGAIESLVGRCQIEIGCPRWHEGRAARPRFRYAISLMTVRNAIGVDGCAGFKGHPQELGVGGSRFAQA